MTDETVQPLLLSFPGATEGTTQWKAELLQLVNWGGFHGHASMPIDPGATLLSGASGTGKSTLLDGYLALMMPSDTPFNGASNDAAGRARGADQRNLLSYLRGKLDAGREAGTGEWTDQVLRGIDAACWGAIGVTFVDDNGRRFTVLRAYFVGRGASRSGEIAMKMASLDGRLDLRELEPLAASHFDKRALKTRWPQMAVHDTYAAFSATLFARLGIGAGGDGSKALRLLARIQGGQQVRTVDGLYKSMVLEEPATYAAADRAIAHFTDLDASYVAMLTEADKARMLQRLPELWATRAQARATEQLIDTFGISREGDTPLLLWQLRTEARLLDGGVEINRAQRREQAGNHRAACDREQELTRRLEGIRSEQAAHGGDTLDRLAQEITDLTTQLQAAENRRVLFDERIAPLGVDAATKTQFDACLRQAQEFLDGFDAVQQDLDEQIKAVRSAGYPLSARRSELADEHTSLKGRTGLVPKRMHEARLDMAHAAGIDPADLPFVAELIDLAPAETAWRTAAEATLYSVARVMLVNARNRDHLSRAIDPVRIGFRIHFEAVEPREHQPVHGDPGLVSGKLVYKDSPYSWWVAERLRRTGTDARCIDGPEQLRGDGLRVTRSGQTRDGARGAHGETGSTPIIGFNNADRLAELKAEIDALDAQLGELLRQEHELTENVRRLHACRVAHQHVLDTDWVDIDTVTIRCEIGQREQARADILAGSDILRALADEHARLELDLEQARRDKFGAEAERKRLDEEHAGLCERQDVVGDHLVRIDNAGTVALSDAQAEHLDGEFTSVGDVDSLPAFSGNVRRLRTRLAETSRGAREAARKATESLCGIFEAYQGRWPDPNLGVGIESYSAYRDILDNILSTGLHERRQEWRRRLSEWSGQDLVPLNGAFDTAIEDIEQRLLPVNAILAQLPFGARRERLKIVLCRLHADDITKFRRELKQLSSGVTQDLSDDEIEARFKRLRAFIAQIRKPEPGARPPGTPGRDFLLDVRKHVEITAARVNAAGVEVATYAALGGKSGGETQELVAFIVGAALRFQLGDEDRARPRFAPIFLDEGFVKSDSEFAGRAVNAWKGLGFQLIIGAPLDKVTALEPDMDLMLTITKSTAGYSHITTLRSPDKPR